MVGLGVAKLCVAKGTNMGLKAGLARILYFIGTFSFHFTGVPLGTWWGGPVSLLLLFLLLDLLVGSVVNSTQGLGGHVRMLVPEQLQGVLARDHHHGGLS